MIVRLTVVNLYTGRIELDADTKNPDEAVKLLAYWIDARSASVPQAMRSGQRVEYRISFGPTA